MTSVYMDYNATTPVDPRVLEAMMPYLTKVYGNPSSLHQYGREARMAMDKSRATIANLLNARESEICFMSGGTEANNLAIRGTAYQLKSRGNHIITSMIEHKAVINTCKSLEKEGFETTFLAPDEYGMISPEKVAAAIRPETILISIMHGNNEVGTINPIEEYGKIAREHNIVFHSDCVQSFTKLDIDVEKAGLHLMSMSAHKIYGPKGIGALYIRRDTPLEKHICGGGQENNRRAGTENLPGIVGFGEAATVMGNNRVTLAAQIGELRDYLQSRLAEEIPELKLNGHPEQRLYTTLNVSFPGCHRDLLLLSLDMSGIAVSGGSACNSGKVNASHVLTAMGLPQKQAESALRISLGKNTTREEVDYVIGQLVNSVKKMKR